MKNKTEYSEAVEKTESCRHREHLYGGEAQVRTKTDLTQRELAQGSQAQVLADEAFVDEWDIELSEAVPPVNFDAFVDAPERSNQSYSDPNDDRSWASPTVAAHHSMQAEEQIAQGCEKPKGGRPSIGVRVRWTRYGPILVFAMALVFFILPTFLGAPSGESQLQSETHSRLLDVHSNKAEADTPQPSAIERLDETFHDSGALTTLSLGAHQTGLRQNSQHQTALANHFAVQLAAIQAEQQQQAQHTAGAQQFQQQLAEHIARIEGAIATLVKQGAQVQSSGTAPVPDPDDPRKSIYVLDTTAKFDTRTGAALPAPEQVNSTKVMLATRGVTGRSTEQVFTDLVLQSVTGDYLNFVSKGCARFSFKIGDAIPGFGVIDGLRGSRVYSHSNRYISRGHFRQCSRAVLLAQNTADSSLERAQGARPVQLIK